MSGAVFACVVLFANTTCSCDAWLTFIGSCVYVMATLPLPVIFVACWLPYMGVGVHMHSDHVSMVIKVLTPFCATLLCPTGKLIPWFSKVFMATYMKGHYIWKFNGTVYWLPAYTTSGKHFCLFTSVIMCSDTFFVVRFPS